MKAIVTGISGQDGYFLSQLLLSKGYEVHGILRRNSSMNQGTIDLLPLDLRKDIIIHYGDITDENFLSKILKDEKPDELYHLAAQSFLGGRVFFHSVVFLLVSRRVRRSLQNTFLYLVMMT